MLIDQFTQVFRSEHRQLRDTFLDIIDAFQKRDSVASHALIRQAIVCAGPHFRYEEEVLYPSLLQLFERDFVEILLIDHDWIIGVMNKLSTLSNQGQFTDDDIRWAVHLVRTMLPHLSDCEGLSIMVERLPLSVVRSILDARSWSLNDGLDLLQWSEQVRRRPYLSPQDRF